MKLTFTIFICCVACLGIVAQKQLDSLYAYQFKNNKWEPTQKRSYLYGIDSKSDYLHFYEASTQAYKLFSYSKETYNPLCNNQILKREAFGKPNNPLEKTSSTIWVTDNQCRLLKQFILLPNGDTTVLYVYSGHDTKGRFTKEIYYSRNASTGKLEPNTYTEYNNIYNVNNKIRSITSTVTKDGIKSLWSKIDYSYTADGKEEIFTFYKYATDVSQWKKSLEVNSSYSDKVNVVSTFTFNNPAGTPTLTILDSFFLDKDKDIIRSASYAPSGGLLANNFKSDYFYSKKTTSIDEQLCPKINVKFISQDENQIYFQIKNPDLKKFDVHLYDINGRLLLHKECDQTYLIEDRVSSIYGTKVFTVYGEGKLVYSKLLGIR